MRRIIAVRTPVAAVAALGFAVAMMAIQPPEARAAGGVNLRIITGDLEALGNAMRNAQPPNTATPDNPTSTNNSGQTPDTDYACPKAGELLCNETFPRVLHSPTYQPFEASPPPDGQTPIQGNQSPGGLAAKACGKAIQAWWVRLWNTCSKNPQHPSPPICEEEPGAMTIVAAKARGRDGLYDVAIEYKANGELGAGRCIVDDGVATPTMLNPRLSDPANFFGPDPPEVSPNQLVDRCLEMNRRSQGLAYASCQKWHAMQSGNHLPVPAETGAPAGTNPSQPACAAPSQPPVTGVKIRGGDGIYAVLLEWDVSGARTHVSACCTFGGDMSSIAPAGARGSHCRRQRFENAVTQ